MRELIKILKKLQADGVELVSIVQVQQWIRQIQRDAQVKRLGLDKD